MAKYVYEGEEELHVPTFGIVLKNGVEFEAPEGFEYPGVSVVAESKKSKTAETTTDPIEEK